MALSPSSSFLVVADASSEQWSFARLQHRVVRLDLSGIRMSAGGADDRREFDLFDVVPGGSQSALDSPLMFFCTEG